MSLVIDGSRDVIPAEGSANSIRPRQHSIRYRVGPDDVGQRHNRRSIPVGTSVAPRNPGKLEHRTARRVTSLASAQTRPQAQQLKDNHKPNTKSRGESERKSLKDGTLEGLQKRHLRAKRAARTRRETVNGWAKRSHWSNSLNFTPDALCSVTTVVSSSSCPKSRALANARLMFTDSNSCMR